MQEANLNINSRKTIVVPSTQKLVKTEDGGIEIEFSKDTEYLWPNRQKTLSRFGLQIKPVKVRATKDLIACRGGALNRR
jgi:hypothetical protein